MASLWKLGELRWQEVGRRVWAELREDAILGRAAQLAFYFLLSIFPLLLFLTALAGYFLRAGTPLREVFLKYLSVVAPTAASGLIETTLQEVATRADGGKLSIGLLLTLWAASSGMVATSHALNIVYEVEETRPWWKKRLRALVLTGALVVLMIMPLGLIMYGCKIAQAIAVGFGLGGAFPVVWNIVQWPIVLAFVLLAFNLVYLYAPNITHRDWHWLMPGTVVGVVLLRVGLVVGINPSHNLLNRLPAQSLYENRHKTLTPGLHGLLERTCGEKHLALKQRLAADPQGNVVARDTDNLLQHGTAICGKQASAVNPDKPVPQQLRPDRCRDRMVQGICQYSKLLPVPGVWLPYCRSHHTTALLRIIDNLSF